MAKIVRAYPQPDDSLLVTSAPKRGDTMVFLHNQGTGWYLTEWTVLSGGRGAWEPGMGLVHICDEASGNGENRWYRYKIRKGDACTTSVSSAS